jgi:parallel beta-helix repeat protein
MPNSNKLRKISFLIFINCWLFGLGSYLFIGNPVSVIPTTTQSCFQICNDTIPKESNSPITIIGNTDFQTQAALNGWNGDGSENDPYRIVGYIGKSISISGTSVYYIIDGSYIDGIDKSDYGINIYNAPNGNISENTIVNCLDGIYVQDSNFIVIEKNEISDCWRGIESSNANNLTIQYNTFSSMLFTGIALNSHESSLILNNSFTAINLDAISSLGSRYGRFSDNSFFNMAGGGIHLDSSLSDNEIRNNTFYLLNDAAISIIGSTSVTAIIIKNTIINSTRGIDIEGKDHKIIENMIINSSGPSIKVANTQRLEIINNTIRFSGREGIQISAGHTSRIENNSISDSKAAADSGAIYLYRSANCTLFNNDIMQSEYHGIYLLGYSSSSETSGNLIVNNSIQFTLDAIKIMALSSNNTIKGNTLRYNYQNGISITGSDKNQIIENWIAENSWNGIYADSGDIQAIIANVIEQNEKHGIQLIGCLYNGINGSNIIQNNRQFGVILDENSMYNNITDNFIQDNWLFGIGFSNTARYNQVRRNDFVLNNHNGTTTGNGQAISNHSTNVIEENFWDDWATPDADNDTWVDYPYKINGTAGSFDNKPKARPGKGDLHVLSRIVITSPTGGELKGTTTVTWTEAVDSLGHDVQYDIAIAPEGGAFTNLGTGLIFKFYVVDTTIITNGSYRFRVTATCTEGLKVNAISNIITLQLQSLMGTNIVFVLLHRVKNLQVFQFFRIISVFKIP